MTAGTMTPLAARASRSLLVIVMLAAVGCGNRRPGPPRVPVTGRVTLDGQPVHPGIVTFFDAELQGTSATIGSDGRYLVTSDRGSGLPAGDYRVTVQAVEPAADPDRLSLPHEAALERPLPRLPIPATYQFSDQTPLRLTISSGGSAGRLVFDLPLTK